MALTKILLVSLLLLGASMSEYRGKQTKYGYTLFEGIGMYRWGTIPVTTGALVWSESFDSCMNDGGHLAIINSQEEADVLRDFVKPSNASFLYIGFSDLFTEGVYVTVHGTPLEETGYSRWYNGRPNGGTSTNCGAVTSSIELADQGCDNDYSYICEMPIWKNYEYVEGLGYYSFETTGLVWSEAVNKCEKDGAHLLIIDSEGEAEVVQDMFNAHPTLPSVEDPYYLQLGIQDLYKEGIYLTLKGERLISNYTTWGEGEPVASTSYNVARLDRAGNFSMYTGSVGYAYICEHEL